MSRAAATEKRCECGHLRSRHIVADSKSGGVRRAGECRAKPCGCGGYVPAARSPYWDEPGFDGPDPYDERQPDCVRAMERHRRRLPVRPLGKGDDE